MSKILIEHSLKEPGSSDFSSRGFRAYVEVDIDARTAVDPEKLDEALADLFAVVCTRIEREAEKAKQREPDSAKMQSRRAADGRTGTGGNGNRASRITVPQLRCVKALEKAMGTDASDMAHDVAGHRRIEDLTVKQASQMIDKLKALQKR